MPKKNVSEFTPIKDQAILLDTNILIHLFYPIISQDYMEPYESLYATALSKKSKFVLSSIQTSEFINRCIRFQYNLFLEANNKTASDCDFKKDYRNTDDYRDSMKAILDIMNHDILPNFTVIDDHFGSIDTKKIFCYGFSYDFNDALLVQIAEKYDAVIVTHDSDFANYTTKQPVISSNKKLLMFS